jgi:glyoxylase-like metal-dependent hydrolase (beta-lactamase superfamily II)
VRIHVSAAEIAFWKNPDFSKTVMPEAVPPALREAAAKFAKRYSENIVQFDQTVEVAQGVSARVTGGHTPGHCVVDVASNGEKLTFVGDAIFEVNFDNPDWQNGFEHDPEACVDVRIALLDDAADTGTLLAAAHVAFPSIGHVAKSGERYRFVPVQWDY